MSNSKEIKPTDGRKGNSRKKSIPVLPVPDEVNAFESLAKKAEEGSYNHMKLLMDFAYGEDDKDTSVKVQAPVINFFGDSIEGKKLKDKIIDVTPKTNEDE